MISLTNLSFYGQASIAVTPGGDLLSDLLCISFTSGGGNIRAYATPAEARAVAAALIVAAEAVEAAQKVAA